MTPILPLEEKRRDGGTLKIVIRWRPLALFGIAVLGLALRLYGLNWDSGNSFQPDERQIMFHVTALAWPKSFAQFLDPVNSPLNPHFFAYGSFPLYLLAFVGNILTHFYPQVNTFFNLTLVGRAINAVFDSGTVLLTGWLALMLVNDETPGRRYAWNVALLAAGFVAFTPISNSAFTFLCRRYHAALLCRVDHAGLCLTGEYRQADTLVAGCRYWLWIGSCHQV